MNYQGDIRLGDTLDFKFTTVNTSGVPTTLAGTPVVSAYVGNSTTQITAGITLTVDFDGITGLHNLRVVATSGNGYAAATNVQLVITTGTVDGSSVVGYVIGAFSIEARSALMPTVAARTLDVTAAGNAGIDWGNVENPSTANNLSATNIDVDQVVASVTGAVGSVTGAVGSVTGNVGGNVTGSVGSVATGGIAAASFAANAIDAAALAADAVQEIVDGVWDEAIAGHLGAGSTGAALNAAGSAGDPWSTPIPGAYGAGTAGKIVGDALDAAVSSRLAPTVAGRTLDVTAGGTAGIDWANIEAPSTAQNLSGTNIDPDQVVASVTGAVGSVTGNVGGNVAGTVGSVVGNVGGNVTGSVGSVVGNVGGNVAGSTGSVSGNVGGNVVGSVGSVVGDVGGNLTGNVGGNVTGSIGSLAAQAKADVNAEVLDVMNVDTFAEPTGVPAATATLAAKIGRLHQSLRNEVQVTATDKTFFNDAGVALWKKALSDDGTTYEEGEGTTP